MTILVIQWLLVSTFGYATVGAIAAQTANSGQGDSLKLDESFDEQNLGDETWIPFQKIRRFVGFRVSADSLPLFRPTRDTTMVSEESFMGFRVQIYHTSHYSQAIIVRNDAMSKFQEEVYVDYESPNYKIRLGDFRRFEQAEELKEYAKSMGYPDAWVIRTKVIIRKE